ncbi:hypothetical protein COW46_00420 [Candidatus Gracilibacteria bacterium CG17_big_fil_post_rev_8_21_14_2_50_48_13]|nr:MAG: hypothetical protein COW46_00420 [Candidatus Gracilibacteria bacterium CG17_big_fil_post_rev_8_21_14_2_50_48_13]
MESEITMERRKQIIKDIAEESYLRDDQKEILRTLVATTEQISVLVTVEDLLLRLFTRRAENYLLVVRKVQQAVRLENRHMDQEAEQNLSTQEEQEASALLKNLV